MSSRETFVFSFQFLSGRVEAAVVGFETREGLSRPYDVDITVATDGEIESFAEVVGSEAVLAIHHAEAAGGVEDLNRYFHGIVRKLTYTGCKGDRHLYQVELVPNLWRLSLRKNCRIFQETTTQKIVETILKEAGILSDRFRFALTNDDRPRGFCVQYCETDFDFVSRLLQEEGIFYFFEHYPDRHIIVFGDDCSAHPDINGAKEITFKRRSGLAAPEESIHSFNCSHQLTPTSFTHRNFFFKRPSLSLTFKEDRKDSNRSYEVYEYPGRFVLTDQGRYLARVRLEELTASQIEVEGASDSCRLIPGFTFGLSDHPVAENNREYLIVAVSHAGEQPQSLEELGGAGFRYENSFQVIPYPTQFRPPRTQPKPVVQGLQTAIVVGPDNERIYTDSYGRVKVQFHWDREGGRNERSSCWIRPAQGWGGGGWGMLFTPRVGDEVLVDFLEGDPDRPIIVGSVYNEANLPLYELPARQTVSAIKTRSYPDGAGFNELRFEDKKGSEEIYLHGERDWTIGIGNDKNQSVGRDETLSIGNNRQKEVGADQRVTIGGNHTEAVGGDRASAVQRNSSVTVGMNSSEAVGLARMLSIGGLYQISVGGAMNETVAGAKAEEVGLNKTVLVGAHMTEKVAGNRSISVGQNFTTTVTQTSSLKASSIIIEADDQILLKAGAASILMKSSGEIIISGGNIQAKASGDVVIKGGKISEN